MSTTNPNVTILNKAWAMLWDSKSNFYVPTVLANGGQFGSTTIPPLQTLALGDLDYPLYNSSTWGNVDISLTDNTISGIPQVSSQSFTPSDDATTVTGTIAFANLTLAGNYEVTGSGIVGCAMDLGLEKALPSGAAAEVRPDDGADVPGDAPRTADAPPSNMALATQYREQLISNGGAGPALVSTYYDQNETINTILNANNAFTAAWPIAEPTGQNTAYYMGVTNVAGQNPTNPNYPVGGEDYNTHSYYMSNMLLGVCVKLANGSQDPENPYVSLAHSIVQFKDATDSETGPQGDGTQLVGSVMNTVENASPTDVAAFSSNEPTLGIYEYIMTRKEVGSPTYLRAKKMAEDDFAMWEARAAAMESARAMAATTYTSSGSYSFSFPMPTLTFNGTVAVTGISPNITMTVTINSLTASIPNIVINLLSGSDPTFTSDVQSKIKDSGWFQQVLGTKVNGELSQGSLLSTVSNIFNQAILTLLP